jgi:hypothetical protein
VAVHQQRRRVNPQHDQGGGGSGDRGPQVRLLRARSGGTFLLPNILDPLGVNVAPIVFTLGV